MRLLAPHAYGRTYAWDGRWFVFCRCGWSTAACSSKEAALGVLRRHERRARS